MACIPLFLGLSAYQMKVEEFVYIHSK